MPASKVQLIGGNFQDAEGNVLALGYLTMRLSSDETVTGVGQIASGIVVKINLNSSGAVDTSVPQSVWGNDQMTPANNFYVVTGYKQNGQLAWGPNNEQVLGNGGTFDTGTWIPNTVVSWTYPAAFGPTGPTGSTGPTGPSGTGATGPTGPAGIFSGSGISSVTGLSNLKQVIADFNSASFTNTGSSAGPGMTNNVQVNATGTEVNMVGFHTTAATGTIAGMNAAPALSNTYTLGSVFSYQTRVQLVQTANTRAWIVWTNSNASAPNAFQSDNPNANLVGFRYSTAAGDTKWVCYTGTSNVAFTATPESTSSHVDTNGHTFAMKFNSGGTSIAFYIDDTLVGTIATTVPAASQFLSPCVFIDNVSTANDQQANVAYMAWLSKF